jgi:glycosyltransferase involved in cell wall biosynthesis
VVLQARTYAVQVIVVNDGSTDETGAIAQAAGATVLQHRHNMGKAAALNTGFLYAKRLVAAARSPVGVVVVMDGDGQHQCSEIPRLAAPILSGEADLVVGSRFLGVKSRIPRWRVFGQQALTLATNLGSGFNLTDSQSGFRAFAPKVLKALDFETDGFSAESEMQFLAQKSGLRVKEVPVHVTYEEPPKRNPFAQGLAVVNGILRLTGQYRPLLYFGAPGILLLMFGMGLGIWVVQRFSVSGELAAGFAMVCLLLSIFGMILISTGVTLHSVRGLLQDLLRRRR